MLRRASINGFALACAIPLLLTACYTEQRVISDPWQSVKDLADQTSTLETRGGTPVAMSNADTGYAILLESFEGDKANTRAARRARKLIDEAKLSGIWIRQVQSRWQVLRGHYADPNLPNAQSDLRQVKMVEVDGLTPYEQVGLVPLRVGVNSALAAYDLKQFRGQSMFSLQVAAFDESYGKEFRAAAEELMQELRTAGEQAYFYHGQHMSMVTIGLFTQDDFSQQKVRQQMPDGDIAEFKQTVYGPRIQEVQRRHPYNLFNGYTVREKLPGGEREQPSMVIEVR